MKVFALDSIFVELENEKQALIDKYSILTEIAKLDKNVERYFVLSKTLNCFENARSAGEIDTCKDEKRRILMKFVRYSSSDSKAKTFKREKDELIYQYKKRIRLSKVDKKSHILKSTLECITETQNRFDVSLCQDYEDEQFVSLLISYKDNEELEALTNKDELVDRYKIRVEMAILDRMYDRVNIFTKTLSCLKNSASENDVKSCKKDETNRILTLIKS